MSDHTTVRSRRQGNPLKPESNADKKNGGVRKIKRNNVTDNGNKLDNGVSQSSSTSSEADNSAMSASNDEGTSCNEDSPIGGRKQPPKRSISEYKRRSKKMQLARSFSETEIPKKQPSLFTNFIEGSKHVVEEAEDFVLHMLQASWRIVHHHTLPDWLKDNEYLVFGHRLPLNSFKACFKSVFRIHTETGNIWTHLLGMIAFIFIASYTLSSRYLDWMWQDITVHSIFFGGAIICLTFSWVYHTVFCHSESVNKLFSKLDYCGIALLTVGSFVPWLYYGFYENRTAHIVYLVSISALGMGCIVVSLFDKFAASEYRPVRAGLFIALGLTGVIPAVHFVVIEGMACAVFEFGFLHLVTMAVLYIGGALMYAFRIPESIWPGKFDIWCQSHQIFHICVNTAALVHFRGIQIISHARITGVVC